MRVRAPGKVNLDLAVGRLEDSGPAAGFHPLATIFQAVSMYEDVTATLADDFSVTVAGRDADAVPTDDTNLAIRAARLLAERCGISAGVQLHLEKGVPVAGGMAGGSADAAATLLACDALWRCGLSRSELLEIGAELGSDVPFPIIGHTALGTGRGDQLTPAMAQGQYFWVFAIADFGLSTPTVFAKFDEMAADREVALPAASDAVMAALRAGNALQLGSALRNDLEPAALALAPSLKEVIALAQIEGALGSIVSGSGPTVAVLAGSAAHQAQIAQALTQAGVCRTAIPAVGPVQGARFLEGPAPGGRISATGVPEHTAHPAGGEWRRDQNRTPLEPVD